MKSNSKNAIVVMFDSLQYNYLGCYGNSWIETPNFDRFAREGVLFEHCYSEGLPTIPCRKAMLTGRYTLHQPGWGALDTDDSSVADLCWGHPIDTALVFDCPMYRLPKFGYTRGFDKVCFTHGHEMGLLHDGAGSLFQGNSADLIEPGQLEKADLSLGQDSIALVLKETRSRLHKASAWKSDADCMVARTMRNAVKYLEQADRNKQFFLWVDSYDPHEPWLTPSVLNKQKRSSAYQGKDIVLPFPGLAEQLYSPEECSHIRELYAEMVGVCDKWFGYLLDNIRRLGLEANTLVMLVSDHGSPLGEAEHGHGLMRKARPWPYEELAHTPLILRAPGLAAGTRVAAFVQSCDVAPTLCEWLGLGAHPQMQGKSLLPLAQGDLSAQRSFAISGYSGFSWSIITQEWSYIHWLRKAEEENQDKISFDMQSRWILEADPHGKIFSKALQSAVGGPGHKAHPYTPLFHKEDWGDLSNPKLDIPLEDELYHRPSDLFQLHNVAAEQLPVCRDLLNALRLFIQEIQAPSLSSGPKCRAGRNEHSETKRADAPVA